jgi:tRNA pseudouridine55 synthase
LEKGSYRSKYIAKTGDTGTQSQGARRYSKIDPELQAEYEEGKVILIDKPVHWTSFDAVKCIRTHLRIKKVGHAGTLDPLATGLLIICTGKYTKKINEYMSQVKVYTGTITLGSVTPTYDLESLPEQHKDYSTITPEKIRETVPSFVGPQKQLPPIYSALKIAGTPMYELARRGKGVELEPRDIHIDSFEITSFDFPVIGFRLVCSTGTYVRSLAHDFGAALGCGAHLSLLRRTGIGDFSVDDACTVDEWLKEIQSDRNDSADLHNNQNA